MRYKVQRCLTGFLSVVMLFLGTVLNLAQASTFTRVDEGVLLDSSRNRYYFRAQWEGQGRLSRRLMLGQVRRSSEKSSRY